jgi:nitrilase
MKVSLIQMNSQENKAANLEQARRLIGEAVAEDRPDLILLPEMFTCLAESRETKRLAAEKLPGGEAWTMLRDLAAKHRVIIHGGSLLETDGDKLYNTSCVFDRDGREIARYRKIHMFDVTTPDGKTYRESSTFTRGTEVVTYNAGGHEIGASICYDIRFPELYQALAKKGAEIIMVPSAFTLQTGKDHWEVLMRARAIETETYILAAGQCGSFANGQRTNYGHSMVVNPWGHVIAHAYDKPGFVTARLDFGYQCEVRQMIPVHQHKVL